MSLEAEDGDSAQPQIHREREEREREKSILREFW